MRLSLRAGTYLSCLPPASLLQDWTSHLGFTATQSWRAWTIDGCRRMGGYVTRYEVSRLDHCLPPLTPPTPLDPLTQPNLTRTNPPPTRYEGSRFDYLTIRGSGHMVPEFKPAAAYELLRAWLKGEDYQPYVTSCKKPH